MSLQRAKAIYCVVMISVAIVLACTAGLLGWITAVLLLSGALPMFKTVGTAMKAATLHDVEQQARLIADLTEPVQPPQPHQGQHSRSA
jgi:hypothetical protein